MVDQIRKFGFVQPKRRVYFCDRKKLKQWNNLGSHTPNYKPTGDSQFSADIPNQNTTSKQKTIHVTLSKGEGQGRAPPSECAKAFCFCLAILCSAVQRPWRSENEFDFELPLIPLANSTRFRAHSLSRCFQLHSLLGSKRASKQQDFVKHHDATSTLARINESEGSNFSCSGFQHGHTR